jgi:arsenate reductase
VKGADMPDKKVKKKVLFVCIHNSARSQIAEAILRHLAGDAYEVTSAGIEVGDMNPLVVEALKQIGIDCSKAFSKSVFDLYKTGKTFNYVITLCDEEHADKCPIFPGVTHRLYWNFKDPSTFTGSDEEKLKNIIQVRDSIRAGIEEFIKNPPPVTL